MGDINIWEFLIRIVIWWIYIDKMDGSNDIIITLDIPLYDRYSVE